MLSARWTPYWRKMPSKTASSPASAAVWEAAARAPASVRPTFTAITGFRASRQASSARRRPSPSLQPSM